MRRISMPKLYEKMEEGTVVEWVVGPGQRVVRGDDVVRIEARKCEAVIEAVIDGVLDRVVIPAGETVVCGTLLGVLV